MSLDNLCQEVVKYMKEQRSQAEGAFIDQSCDNLSFNKRNMMAMD